MLVNVLAFVLILGLLVLVHEFGHFLIAKRNNVKVEEFGIGFPPKVLTKKVGETIYSLNLIPLGGFVRLYGEEGKYKEKERSFSHKPVFTRAKIMIAGVLLNFILGYLVLVVYFSLGGVPAVTNPAKYLPAERIDYQTVVAQVQEGSPAEKIDIKQGAIIEKIDEQVVDKSEKLSNYTKDHPGKVVKVQYTQEGKTFSRQVKLSDKKGKGQLGVAIGQGYGSVDFHWYQLPLVAFEEALRIIGLIFYFVYKIIEKLIVKQEVMKGVVGPVGIYTLTGQVVKMGIAAVLRFTAFLSLNFAVLNLLPIPALDGGQLVILGFEKVKGSKVKPSVEKTLQIIGFSLLIILTILITYRDIVQLL